MGSPNFRSLELDGLGMTEAWFCPAAFLARHTHERPSVAIMLAGSFDLQMGGRTYHCAPSAVVTEPAGEAHANRIGTRGSRVVVIQPDLDQEELLRPFAAILARPSHHYHAGLGERAARLAGELAEPDDLSGLAAEILALEILVALARLPGVERRGPPGWLLRAQELVHARFAEPLRAVEVAREVDVHPAHLARAFRIHFRMSLGSYVRRLRLEWAATELRSSSRSLASLALAAGFADQSHFTRAFRRHTGLTPNAYRQARR